MLGSPKVTVPEDKLVVSSHFRPRKEKGETIDEEVHHPLRRANPAVRMIQDTNPEIRVMNRREPAPLEQLTNRFVSSVNRND